VNFSTRNMDGQLAKSPFRIPDTPSGHEVMTRGLIEHLQGLQTHVRRVRIPETVTTLRHLRHIDHTSTLGELAGMQPRRTQYINEIILGICQGCKKPERQVALATKFCTVAPSNKCLLSTHLVHVRLSAPKILSWLPGFRF
jgi:hypothetical protein